MNQPSLDGLTQMRMRRAWKLKITTAFTVVERPILQTAWDFVAIH